MWNDQRTADQCREMTARIGEDDVIKVIEDINKKVNFFVPNYITNYLIDTFFSKEPETLEWIDSFDKNKKVIFWDIGANIGIYSIYAALKHSDIEVVCFEPSTSNLRILSRNISRLTHSFQSLLIVSTLSPEKISYWDGHSYKILATKIIPRMDS